jgi:septation ring formation regulator EzrA
MPHDRRLGDDMLILLGIVAYVVIVVSVVRVFQSIRKRDEEMRLITEEWLSEIADLPLEPGK